LNDAGLNNVPSYSDLSNMQIPAMPSIGS
jgi:hypothetical protein